jgi:hypothetical protein
LSFNFASRSLLVNGFGVSVIFISYIINLVERRFYHLLEQYDRRQALHLTHY